MFIQLFVVPSLWESLNLKIITSLFSFETLLVLLFNRDFAPLLIRAVEQLDGLVHTLLVVETHESLDFLGVPDPLGNLAGEDVPSWTKVSGQVLGLRVARQALDHDIELVDDLGVLDLPHESELFVVEFVVVLVLQCLLGFILVPEVDVAKAK